MTINYTQSVTLTRLCALTASNSPRPPPLRSGKDYTKVDRSAAYAARWVAKSLVKAGLCRRCLVQVSYAIGVAEPISITVFHYGTSQLTQKQLLDIVKKNFDLRPGRIVK